MPNRTPISELKKNARAQRAAYWSGALWLVVDTLRKTSPTALAMIVISVTMVSIMVMELIRMYWWWIVGGVIVICLWQATKWFADRRYAEDDIPF